MFNNITAILIWSDNYKKLAQWYIEKLELEPVEELTHPDDTGIGFQLGDIYFWVGQHSQVHGKNQDPHRHMINFTVPSVTKAYELLLSRNVEFIAAPFKAPTFDKYFATFLDLDGNIVQIVGKK